MIIHSIVADEVIFAGIEDIVAPEEMLVNGLLMQVERMSNNEVRLIRLISPDLEPYLNDTYLPGQIIRFIPSP
jgi:hypothetical protein